MSLISYQAENHIKESFINCHSYVLHIVMKNYKKEEEEIERLVRRLVNSVNEDVIMDDDQRQESVNGNLMGVDTGQQDTLSPSLGNMCGVSTADTSLTGEITQGSEQLMVWSGKKEVVLMKMYLCWDHKMSTMASTLHYQLLVSMSGESARPPPQDINKLALHDQDVGMQAKKI